MFCDFCSVLVIKQISFIRSSSFWTLTEEEKLIEMVKRKTVLKAIVVELIKSLDLFHMIAELRKETKRILLSLKERFECGRGYY